MSISNSESRTAEPGSRQEHSTALRAGSIGVLGILFFVLSAQAPLTGIVGASPLAAALGNGAGAPGAYLIVGIVIVIFAVGFVAMSRKVQTNGAFYAYVTAAFGRKIGAGAAWLALLAYSTIQAAMYGLYGAAFSGLLASAGLDVPWWLLALATMAGVQVLGSLNIELGARVLAVLVGLEVAVLLMFGFSVLFKGGGPEGLDVAASFSPEAIASRSPRGGHHVCGGVHVRLRIHGHLLRRSQGPAPDRCAGHLPLRGHHRRVLFLHLLDAGQLLRAVPA